MLSVRIISIFRELLAAEKPLTSEYLAKIIQVTSRTIRNDIKELDLLLTKHGSTIKSERGKGYLLTVYDNNLFRKMLQDFFQNEKPHEDFIPNSPEDRVQFIIKQLLLSDNFVKIEDLADELFISRSTMQNDLQDVKKILKKYELELETRPNYGFRLKGNELKRRFCMSEYLFDRNQSEIDVINSQIKIIPKEEIVMIKSIIFEHIVQYEIDLSDIGIKNLIIHIAIGCSRIRNGKHVSLFPDELKAIIDTNEYKVASQIVSEIEKGLDVKFPKTEIAYVAIHLLGTKMVVEEKISETEIKSLMDDEIFILTKKILNTIEKELNLGIKNDKELLLGLCIHLKPAINRFRYGMNLRNPMINAIKVYYPVAFQAGVIAGITMKKELGIAIHENEIGYIALHIGAAMERKKMTARPKRCIIVCASGIGSAKLLNYKLQTQFGARLEILGTTEYYKLSQISLHSLDFIVSTIPITESLSIPVINVNTILGGQDLEKIERMLTEKNEENKFEYTKQELVFLQKRLETRDEVLFYLGRKLQQLQLVDDHYIDKVLEREAISPTSFGNFVAIPHPITPQTDSTFWAVCTLVKPILWGDKPVQFICLLNVEKNSTADFQKMYNILGSVVDNKHLVEQLLKCKTYREFISIFLQKCKED